MKPRGCLPDGVDKSRIILIKACSHLRLTYEIKLATYFAKQTSRRLVIAIPESHFKKLPPESPQEVFEHTIEFHLEDGRFISVPVAFYPTLALATAKERGKFEINGSSVYWPELDADIGVEGLLAGAREHHFYARKAVERAVRLKRLPKTALEKFHGKLQPA
jgi:hypothetical protein